MAKSKILTYFFVLTIISIVGLFFLFYENYTFKNAPLPQTVLNKIKLKEQDILKRIATHYKTNFKAPIVISDKLPDKNFGMATYDSKSQKIVIYLNKNRFFESEAYMIEDVLPHEYAHALMFVFGEFSTHNAGHTKRWQKACQDLGGVKCNRFVNHQDIVIDKTKLFE